MPRIEVAVAAPLLHTLSYSFDSEKDGNPLGRRVLVHLGRQRVTGYVLGLLPEEDVSYRILPIMRFLDDDPLFPENLVPFYRWIADYYHHPIGEVIKTALPGGLTQRNRKILQLTESGRGTLGVWPLPEKDEPAWFSVLLEKNELSPAVTKKLLIDNDYKKLINQWQEDGIAAFHDILDKAKTSEKRELCYVRKNAVELPGSIEGEEGRKALKAATRQKVDNKSLTVPFVRTLFHLSQLAEEQGQDTVAARDLRKIYSGASKALKELETRGMVSSVMRRIYRNPFGETLAYFSKPQLLSEEQDQVLAAILPALQQKKFSPFLLHGVTGCGKTEVYLRAAEETLALGRDVLILVPEIALATQLESHFVSRFGDQVVLLHSGLSPGERFDQWSLAAIGRG